MQFVSQTQAVALNCLSSQRCSTIILCGRGHQKGIKLDRRDFFRRRSGNAIVGLAEFFSADFRPADKIRQWQPNSAAQGSRYITVTT